MEMVVRMFNPRTLQAAYSLAKFQEALKNDPRSTRNTSRKGFISRTIGRQKAATNNGEIQTLDQYKQQKVFEFNTKATRRKEVEKPMLLV